MESAQLLVDHAIKPTVAPRLGFLFGSLAAVTALADCCFWRDQPRLSVGLFGLGTAAIILLNRPAMRWTRPVALILALICGAALESAIDLCFSNGLVLFALLLALGGETYYESLRSGWSRLSELLWTIVKTPARWIWLAIAIADQARLNGPAPGGMIRKCARIAWIAVPGLLVTAIFAVVLGDGNALFAKFADDWTAEIRDWILQFDLSFWRCVVWVFVAGIALPILWPSPAPEAERIWARELPLLPDFTAPRTARLQSAVMLGLLNALFCFVNTIDAVYLWAGQALPAGVTASKFVHEGVFSLIVAVLFSALLLAGVFQQSRSVSAWTPLRVLGLVWIAQNLVLLAGVFLRVKLYLDAFDLTVTRVNLVFFLALVTVGFLLLAIRVWWQRTLGWLLCLNVLATFFLFYTVQFLDTNGFVARYNVGLWERSHETRALDLAYLKSLGPPAFEALECVARSGNADLAPKASDFLKEVAPTAQRELNQTPFASWQLRNMLCQRKLLTSPVP